MQRITSTLVHFGLRLSDVGLFCFPVFRLTKTEKQIVAFVLLAFLCGWGYREWKARDAFEQAAKTMIQDERQH